MQVHEFVHEDLGHSSYALDRHCLDVGREHLLGEFDRGIGMSAASAPGTWATATGKALEISQ